MESTGRKDASTLLFVGGIISLVLSCSACSPLYVLEAGWTEAGILIRRERISRLIASPTTDTALKEKLLLVLAVREYAHNLGLTPRGSYSKYAAVDRDVLVWVLSAAPKTALRAKTWWFPIVGSVPYKGFFDKDDAIREAEWLKRRNFDTFIRPSNAFSTLGWFDDPLLSTMLRGPDTGLVNTVIHEIFHNSFWFRGSVEFNESLANFVGSRGAAAFFRLYDGVLSERARVVDDDWHDELIYAEFLSELSRELESLYARGEKGVAHGMTEAEILAAREEVFAAARGRWVVHYKPRLRGTRMLEISSRLNNAVIIADRIYLSSPELFEELYRLLGSSLERFIRELRGLEGQLRKTESPFHVIRERVKELKEQNRSYVNSM